MKNKILVASLLSLIMTGNTFALQMFVVPFMNRSVGPNESFLIRYNISDDRNGIRQQVTCIFDEFYKGYSSYWFEYDDNGVAKKELRITDKNKYDGEQINLTSIGKTSRGSDSPKPRFKNIDQFHVDGPTGSIIVNRDKPNTDKYDTTPKISCFYVPETNK
jgi:hypothetical protein